MTRCAPVQELKGVLAACEMECQDEIFSTEKQTCVGRACVLQANASALGRVPLEVTTAGRNRCAELSIAQRWPLEAKLRAYLPKRRA